MLLVFRYKIQRGPTLPSLDNYFQTEDQHPIDVVEVLAELQDWDFNRVAEDQITMVIEEQWRTHSITLSWSNYDESLFLISTYEFDSPKNKVGLLYEALNLANEECYGGAFYFWNDKSLIVYRNALALGSGAIVSPNQINRMLETAVSSSERFYPAFQLVCWGDRFPKAAMQIAIADGLGHA